MIKSTVNFILHINNESHVRFVLRAAIMRFFMQLNKISQVRLMNSIFMTNDIGLKNYISDIP